MKKLFFTLSIIFFASSIFAQSKLKRDIMEAKQTLIVNGYSIEGISNDSIITIADSLKLVTQYAMKKYVDANGGNGGFVADGVTITPEGAVDTSLIATKSDISDSILTVSNYTELYNLTNYSNDIVLVDSFKYDIDAITYQVVGGAYRKTNCIDNGGTCISGWSRILESRYVDFRFFEGLKNADRINRALEFHNNIVIGNDTTDLILLEKSIIIGSSKDVIINGHLQNAASVAITMTTDVLDGATSIVVPDGSVFEVGQWIGISDDNSDVQVGSNQTRRVGAVSEILNIVGNTLTVTEIEGDYTVAQNSYIARANNLITIKDAKNVRISGTGLIDGNFANQVDFEGIEPAGTSRVESFNTQCGVSILSSSNVVVGKGLTIKDNTLHNLVSFVVDNIKVEGINSYNAHDKSFLISGTTNSTFEDNYIEGSLFEDGIIMYSTCSNNIIINNIVKDCPRYGIVALSEAPNNFFNNNYIDNCNLAFSVQSPNNEVRGLTIKNGPLTTLDILISDFGNGTPETKNTFLSDVTIDGNNESVQNVIQLNSVENTSFVNLNIRDNTATSQQIKINTGTKNVRISGGSITNCHDAILEAGGTDSIDIVNFQLKEMGITPTISFSNINLINCRGFGIPNKLTGNFVMDGNLGIGTAVPSAGVHVANKDIYAIGGANRRFLLGTILSGSGYGGFRYNASGNIDLIHGGYGFGGSTIISATALGRIGIRNNAPLGIIDITGNVNEPSLIFRGQSTSKIALQPYYDLFTDNGLGVRNEVDSTIMKFSNFDGFVGIGRFNPEAKFDVTEGLVRFSTYGQGNNSSGSYSQVLVPDQTTGEIGEFPIVALQNHTYDNTLDGGVDLIQSGSSVSAKISLDSLTADPSPNTSTTFLAIQTPPFSAKKITLEDFQEKVQSTGWADYADTEYNPGSPYSLLAGTKVTLPNNGGNILDIQIPTDIDSMYTIVDQKITGRNGDGLNVLIEFSVKPTSGADTRVTTSIDIGGGVGEIYKRDFILSKGNGVEHYYSASFSGYTLGTWEANGGEVKVEATGGPVDIYNVRYVLTRTHKAR